MVASNETTLPFTSTSMNNNNNNKNNNNNNKYSNCHFRLDFTNFTPTVPIVKPSLKLDIQPRSSSLLASGPVGFKTVTEDDRKLKVDNLSSEVSETDLQDFFDIFLAKVGNGVENVFVVKDRTTGAAKYAYVTFRQRRHAELVLQKLQGHPYDHMILRLSWAPPKTQTENDWTWRGLDKKSCQNESKRKDNKPIAAPLLKGTAGKTKPKSNRGVDKGSELLFADKENEDHAYAKIIKMLGSGRCETECFDGRNRLGHICGRLRQRREKIKGKKIVEGDLVLVSLRAFQDDKCDIIHKYTVKEANKLRKMGEIPKNARIGLSRLQEEEEDQWLAASGLTADDDIGIDFDDDDEEFDIECI